MKRMFHCFLGFRRGNLSWRKDHSRRNVQNRVSELRKLYQRQRLGRVFRDVLCLSNRCFSDFINFVKLRRRANDVRRAVTCASFIPKDEFGIPFTRGNRGTPDPAYRRIKRTGLHRANAVRRPRKKASQLAKFIGKLTGGSPPEVNEAADVPYGAPGHPLTIDTQVPRTVGGDIDLSDAYEYREYFMKQYCNWHSIPIDKERHNLLVRLYNKAWRRSMVAEDNFVAIDATTLTDLPGPGGLSTEQLMELVPELEQLPKFYEDLVTNLRTHYRGFARARYKGDPSPPGKRQKRLSF